METFRDGDLMPPNLGQGVGMGDIDVMFDLTRSENLLQKNIAERARLEAERTRREIIENGGDPNLVPPYEPPGVVAGPTFNNLPDFLEQSRRKLADEKICSNRPANVMQRRVWITTLKSAK
jgi:hypothetical protein